MSLEDTLKTQTLAAVAHGVDQWQSDLRRALTHHEEVVARSLDSLQRAAALDLGTLESGLAAAISSAIAASPAPEAPAARTLDFAKLRASLAAMDRATSLSEAMTTLVNESLGYAERAVMFIVKGPSAVGWYGKGAAPDIVKSLVIPLNESGPLATVFSTKQPLRGAEAISRLGGSPGTVHIVPLILRDKVGAILYADAARESSQTDLDSLEILTQYAAKVIDLITTQRAAKVATGSSPTLSSGDRTAAAARVTQTRGPVSGPVKVQVAVPPPVSQPPTIPPPLTRIEPPSAPAPSYVSNPVTPPTPVVVILPPTGAVTVAPITEDDGASTVIFDSAVVAASMAPPAPVPVPVQALSDAAQKAHDQAKRFARLVVSEIKLYNESKVSEGRRHRDLYERLKEDIERGRQVYTERVPADVRDSTNYFYDELVRVLAAGDATALGPM
jgi:hypothetical protein